MDNTLPTREQLGEKVFQEIECLLEAGNSQSLGKNQALQIAAWALQIAGERYLRHHVLMELDSSKENNN